MIDSTPEPESTIFSEWRHRQHLAKEPGGCDTVRSRRSTCIVREDVCRNMGPRWRSCQGRIGPIDNAPSSSRRLGLKLCHRGGDHFHKHASVRCEIFRKPFDPARIGISSPVCQPPACLKQDELNMQPGPPSGPQTAGNGSYLRTSDTV